MLPANHVIQYSPRLASNNSAKWSPRPQQYLLDVTPPPSKTTETDVELINPNTVEPMEVDGVEMTAVADIIAAGAPSQQSSSGHDSSISCPLFPRGTPLVTCTAEVQLDHDQNLNNAGVVSNDGHAGDINNPQVAIDAVDADIVATSSTTASRSPTDKGGATVASAESPPTFVMTTSPEPRPRTKSFVTPNSNNNKSADMADQAGGGPQQKRTPVPTPRKSVTLPMEVETSPSPTDNDDKFETNRGCFEVTEVVMLPPPERSQSALGDRAEKKISFSVVSGGHPGGQTKKLSTFSLHATSEASAEVGLPEEAPLQRRNSIHNVPYVDVNDPSTRERMERYKEERRSMLRAKYKVEDYMTSTTEANNKYRRKSTEQQQQQQQQNHENNSTSSVQLRKESAPATLNLKTTTINNGTTKIIDKKSNSSPVRETGLIDEDVNVKERAAIFGVTTSTNSSSNNRSKSWATTNNLNIAKNEINKRPMSESHVNNSRKLSPGSPSKIRDMAALFEQKN